jgi:hypothetical protein
MLIYVFDLSPVRGATYMQLELTCPNRELLDKMAWRINQHMVRDAVGGHVTGKLDGKSRELRCVSIVPWQEIKNHYADLKAALDTGGISLPSGVEVAFKTFEEDRIVATYSIPEHRADEIDELFAAA